MATIYLGLGANLGDRAESLRRAVRALPPAARVVACSRVYRTDPVGPVSQGAFYNAVVRAETDLSPPDLLRYLHDIERRLGRDRDDPRNVRFGPRVIDIDLLLYDDLVVERPDLVVPHPRLRERAFALVPLSEVMPPEATLPPDGRALAELIDGVRGQGIEVAQDAALSI